jgi:hypothetical protein
MARTLLAALLVTAFVVAGDLSDSPQPSTQPAIEVGPDPTQAQEFDHWPDATDLARLQSVEGKPKVVICQVLGHPSRVERRPDGEEVWDYRWCAACRVWIRKGVCTGTFYTAGY